MSAPALPPVLQPLDPELRALLAPLFRRGPLVLGYDLEDVRLCGRIELVWRKAGQSFILWVCRMEDAERSFAQTERHRLGHLGEPPDPQALQLILAMAEILRHWEARGVDHHLARYFEVPRGVAATGESLEVRVTLRCNERCPFCGTGDSAINVAESSAEVESLIEQAPGLGVNVVTLTGGEPTLRPELPRWIRRIHELGLKADVQTNAVLLDDPGVWDAYVGPDGRPDLPDVLLVSLHTQHPERLAALVGVPGARLDRKLAAIRIALARGIYVRVNFVVTTLNADEIDAFPGFLAATYPHHLRKMEVMFSFATPHGRMEANRNLWPRIPDVAPALGRALERSEALGLQAMVPDTCGLPPCVLPDHARFFWTSTRAAAGAVVPYERMKWTSCRQCRWDDRCIGVWRAYVALHGAEGFGVVPAGAGGR